MRQTLLVCLAVGGLLSAVPPARAQVSIRLPFVRVQVGGPGVAVRAPFVDYFAPSYPPPYYYGYYAVPRTYYYVAPQPYRVELATPAVPTPAPQQSEPAQAEGAQPEQLPPPKRDDVPDQPDDAPPPAAGPAEAMTLEQFAKSFKPKAGSYEVELLNPVTRQPDRVRFTLPEGAPRRVDTRRNEIEFNYGPRQFVRIEFDRDGAIVTSR